MEYHSKILFTKMIEINFDFSITNDMQVCLLSQSLRWMRTGNFNKGRCLMICGWRG